MIAEPSELRSTRLECSCGTHAEPGRLVAHALLVDLDLSANVDNLSLDPFPGRIVHVRIPKTAGMALSAAFRLRLRRPLKVYPERFDERFGRYPYAGYNFFSGHTGFADARGRMAKLVLLRRRDLLRLSSSAGDDQMALQPHRFLDHVGHGNMRTQLARTLKARGRASVQNPRAHEMRVFPPWFPIPQRRSIQRPNRSARCLQHRLRRGRIPFHRSAKARVKVGDPLGQPAKLQARSKI